MATAAKSERLMNLVICLLVARTYVGKAKIREVVQGYHGTSDDAFEKMFERDKDELRELGIPIEVGYVDRAFEDEPGYRIRRQAFELPDIRLDGDEAAVVGLAARVWQHASLAEATSGALVKLRAGGVDVDTSALAVVEPHLAAPDPAFDPLWNAVVTRTAVRFEYRRPHAAPDSEPAVRTLEPWGILSWHGHWYVVGHDRDRDAARMFRLSRVQGKVSKAGRAGSFEVPEGTDIRALAAGLAPDESPAGTATLRVRSGHGFALRRGATSVTPVDDGWDRLEAPFGTVAAMAELVTTHGADVVVESPAELRDAVVARLRDLAGMGAV
ncbi:MAG TPA: WYL domain-containing protein [Nocardioidaceae bacterium]|nr:WYL domain-containing protein [Nocardioidaceae bacterium]